MKRSRIPNVFVRSLTALVLALVGLSLLSVLQFSSWGLQRQELVGGLVINCACPVLLFVAVAVPVSPKVAQGHVPFMIVAMSVFVSIDAWWWETLNTHASDALNGLFLPPLSLFLTGPAALAGMVAVSLQGRILALIRGTRC